jgi:hypothetical protein
VTHSVGYNSITGDAANHLATVVLQHATMTDFCGIPLASLRENCFMELDLNSKCVDVPGAIVLSKLLPSAAAVTSLKCACRPKVFAFLSAPIDTPILSPSPPHPSLAVSDATGSETRVPLRSPPSSRRRRSPT